MISKSCIEIVEPAPVLNIPEFHAVFGHFSGDSKYIEFVALAGQTYLVEEIYPRHHHSIYKISLPSYETPLFLDSRFTRPASNQALDKPQPDWKRSDLARKMEQLLGSRYIWGGNWSLGISKMLHYYPPQKALDDATLALWTLRGVDCSGLLYEVTNGATPRNTNQLIHFGKALPIEGKSPAEIAKELLPMDMVVWPGHVWFAFDSSHSIESKSPFGVIRRPLIERLEETCKERTGADGWSKTCDRNRNFTIRRFCSH